VRGYGRRGVALRGVVTPGTSCLARSSLVFPARLPQRSHLLSCPGVAERRGERGGWASARGNSPTSRRHTIREALAPHAVNPGCMRCGGGLSSLLGRSAQVPGLRRNDASSRLGRGASRGGGGEAGGARRSIPTVKGHGSRRGLRVRALDAAQPFDYEARAVARRKANEMQQLQAATEAAKGPKLTIGARAIPPGTPRQPPYPSHPAGLSHALPDPPSRQLMSSRLGCTALAYMVWTAGGRKE